jgi:hypothetical protein
MTDTNQPEQTIIPEIEEHLKTASKPKEQIVITISFEEINKAITLFQNCQNVRFDPRIMSYYVDGSEVRQQFLAETIEKFSQYITAASQLMRKVRVNPPQKVKTTLQTLDNKLKDVTKDAEIQP